MIETVFLDWGLAFGAGVLFAIAGRAELNANGSRLRTRAFRWGFAYLHAGVLAISLAAYAMNRDWMWMYWVDPRTLPAGIQVLAFVLYEVCFVAGFVIAAEVSKRAAWMLAGATAVAITTLELTARTRLFRFGTIEEFRAGASRPGVSMNPFEVEPIWALVSVAGLASLVALALALRKLHRTAAEAH